MKKFLIMILAFCFTMFALMCAAYFIHSKESHDYLAAMNHKIKLLDSVPSPRLIFAGGSNVCFGIDSKRISDSIGLPVIDTALHASIGLKMQIELVESRIRPDDILVIMPEIAQFYGHLNGEAETLSGMILHLESESNVAELIRTMNREQLMNMVIGLPGAVFGRAKENAMPVSDSTYNALAFNQNGDQQWHWNDHKRYKVTFPTTSKPFDERSVSYLADKVTELRSAGVKVILFPPTMMQSYYDLNGDRLDKVYEELSSMGIDFDLPSGAHVMPDDYALDTMYHMNKLGVDSLSTLLIDELKGNTHVGSVGSWTFVSDEY